MYSYFKLTAQVSAYTMTYILDGYTYAHFGCRQLLQGVNVQHCRLVATIFASTIAPRPSSAVNVFE